MKVPKPFDPNRQRVSEPQPQRVSEPQQQAQVQSEEPSTPQEAPREATEASGGPEAEGDTQLPPEESSPSAGAADKPEPSREDIPVAAGVFSALAELIGDSTLLMTLCKHGDDLTVTVTPFDDDKDSNIQSVAVTATAAELDEGFVQAIRVKTEGRKALAEQIEALKAAEKELVDAKKAETDAKTKEADRRKKAADDIKKEDEKKAKEAEEKKKAEEEAAKKAGEQASIF
jgi:PRTRC genetic system protein E